MSAGFKVWNLLNNETISHNPHIASAAIAASVLLVGGVIYRATAPKTNAQSSPDEDYVPTEKFCIRNIFELCGEFVQGLAKDIIGPHYYRYFPMMIFIFLWVLLNNLLGSFPGLGSATDNLNTTLSMGIFIFFYYNIVGLMARGVGYAEDYTGHLKGVLLWTMGVFIMFPIELISNAVRPITLGIRLRSNIYADHAVYGIITGLFKDFGAFLEHSLGSLGALLGHLFGAVGPIPIMILGLLVAFIQAFVFTMLSMIYVGMATAHEEH